MANVLCWEEKYDGRYCKNYPLKNKKKCQMHQETQNVNSIVVLVLILVSSMYILNYVNSNTTDAEIILKEYLLKLYKIDKNMINVYMNTINLLATNYYNLISTYITKTREII